MADEWDQYAVKDGGSDDWSQYEVSDKATAVEDLPKAKEGLAGQAAKVIQDISKSIPLSDRIKMAGLVGRGMSAIEKGIKIQDAPSIAAKMASGALQGVPEFVANNPVAAGVEQGAKLMGAVPDRSLFPKAATKEGERLGNELGIASSFVTALAPIKEKSIAERITKSAAEKMKTGRETVANATKKIVEFDSKVRGEYFGARVKAGDAFEESLKAVQKATPGQKVDLMAAFKGLGVELDEAGQITSQNPKLLSDLQSALRKSGNKTLQNILSTGDASNLTLEQTQDIVSSIKKIPSFAQKLNQGKFANWTDTDAHVIQFIEDVRDAQLSAFPEFEKTLGAYRETMHKFRIVKPFFKETNLITNMLNDFQNKPVIKKFVRDLLPKNIVKDIDNVRKVSKIISSAKKTAIVGAEILGASALAGVGFRGLRK